MSIFSAADILLPSYNVGDSKWKSYSVIACDQFTGEPEYWENAEKEVNGNLSTLDYILPEAYLETEKEGPFKEKIKNNMKNISDKLSKINNCMIYLERTLPDGNIRKGIVGKIDLEHYDFSSDSTSSVRATEKTVIERVPPRVAIRKDATVEFPHIMVFSDDPSDRIINSIDKNECELVYDFELMLGGGRVKGYIVKDEQLKLLEKAIFEYEKSKDGVVYAVGDGNHSLAAAKSHYNNIKEEFGEKAENHPARYALCEIVNIHEKSIEFEPIYRLVYDCDVNNLLTYINNKSHSNDTIEIISNGRKEKIQSPDCHPLVVGALQIVIDDYISNVDNNVKCDYIHGIDSLLSLSEKENAVGFIFDGIEKEDLFEYIKVNGVLPRKTFSMGEAKSKRYYLESRTII